MEKPGDGAERSRAASMTHDMALRESAPPLPRAVDHSRHPSATNNNNGPNGPERLSNDIWTSAISRLQAQVSYNTGMLESHRRQFADMENAITRLHQETNNILGMLTDLRTEVRSRPPASEPPRHDAADLDILTSQLHRLTNKVNEIDGLGLQTEMLKNRIKRLEDGGTPAPTPGQQPTSARRDPPNHELSHPPPAGPQISHQPTQHPPPPPLQQQQHPPLPPMRTGSIPSPQTNRPPSFPAPNLLESHNAHPHRPTVESRPLSGDTPPVQHPPPGAGFRPSEPLPPPSAISGWRPAEPYPQPPGHSPANAPAAARGHTGQPESQGPQPSGWAAVNNNAAIKRPPEEGRSPYGSPSGDSSKRPKLAPLMPNMPRSNYGEEGFAPPQSMYHSTTGSNLSDASHQPRSQAPSDGSQPQSQPTPASTLQHSFRFITSTQQADSPESWRPESQREAPLPPQGNGRGGRGGRGRGRGRGGRGRGGSSAHGGNPEPSELGTTPEWERPEWSGNHGSPNGYYNHMQHLHSPQLASRGGILHRADAHVGGPIERHHEFPATPTHGLPPDPYAAPPDATQSSSGKKTRTKPFRNAEGILIRKDGRPDMRSVSSANNLRKVHAKKEAERAEMEDDGEGITRSGTPTSVAAGDHDTSDEAADSTNTQERHRELMNRIFAHGQGRIDGSRAAEQFFPRHEEAPPTAPAMKMERDGEVDGRSREQSSQAADVVMKEASEAPQAEEERPSEEKSIDKEEEIAGQHQEHAANNETAVSVQPAAAAAAAA